MKNIFKRRKKPLIIAPPHFISYKFTVSDSFEDFVQTENDTVIISDPITTDVTNIEEALKHIRSGVKIINIFGNCDDMIKQLREDGYNVDFLNRNKIKITSKVKEGNTNV